MMLAQAVVLLRATALMATPMSTTTVAPLATSIIMALATACRVSAMCHDNDEEMAAILQRNTCLCH